MKRQVRGIVCVTVMLAPGCAKLAFVSDRGGNLQIYEMRATGAAQRNMSNNPHIDSFPDVFSDGRKIAFSSTRGGQGMIITRDSADSDGSTEHMVTTGSASKFRPRSSPKQDLIAFAEWRSSGEAAIFAIRADGTGAPIQVTVPPVGDSDHRGHDFFDNGSKIVFARRRTVLHTFDLFFQNSDGSGSPQAITNTTNNLYEELPVVSHDGKLLAYREYVRIPGGFTDVIRILEVGTWAAVATIKMQPPVEDGSIRAIAFSRSDRRLYVAARSSDISATPTSKRYELFSIKLDGTSQRRLTNNQDLDTDPTGIPCRPGFVWLCNIMDFLGGR